MVRHTLKTATKIMIYFTVLHLSKEIYQIQYGFTKVTDLYIDAESEEEIEVKAKQWLKEQSLKNIEILKINSVVAQKQDRERYLRLI